MHHSGRKCSQSEALTARDLLTAEAPRSPEMAQCIVSQSDHSVPQGLGPCSPAGRKRCTGAGPGPGLLSSCLALLGCFLFSFVGVGVGVINKDLSKQADPYSTYLLGEKSLGHWRGPDGQGGTLAEDTQTLGRRVNQFSMLTTMTPTRPSQAPGHPSHPPGDPQSHSSPAGNSGRGCIGLPHSSHPLTAEPSCNIQIF